MNEIKKEKKAKKLKVKAECHSDDHRVEIDFDATKWFEQASDKEIEDLADCGWGGNEPADWVAEFYEKSTTRRLFVYLSFKPTMPYSGDTCGFECNVDNADAVAWVKKNRPKLYEKHKEEGEWGWE